MEIVLTGSSRQTLFHIDDASQVAAARRTGCELAKTLGFDEIATGRVALVITEAATNIVKHAIRGQILLRGLVDGDAHGLEVIALDAGPGMRNIAFNMEDGHSTAGSYGAGLGAMRRQSGEFDIYSVPDGGTAVHMVLWGDRRSDHVKRRRVGVVCLPLAGEDVCGDAWAVVESADCLSVLVADGLGHGPDAAKASQAAVATAEQNPDATPAELMQDIHAALRSTRGAATGLARLDFHSHQLHFVGVGNIAASIHEGDSRRHLVSSNGIVGSNMRLMNVAPLSWNDPLMLIMHSDGIATGWDLKDYPGLASRHPSVIAAIIYRDFARVRDDATILVISAS